MNYAEIKYNDIANGPGVRTTLFVSGCTHYCKGCFNEIAWDFDYGKEFTDETIREILDSIDSDYITGMTILGGEPFEYVNQQGILPLVKQFRERFPKKSLWIFTGYLFDRDLIEDMSKKWPETMEILKCTDIIVDGEFKEELKSMMLKFKGSSNQRTIKVQDSLEMGEVQLLYED